MNNYFPIESKNLYGYCVKKMRENLIAQKKKIKPGFLFDYCGKYAHYKRQTFFFIGQFVALIFFTIQSSPSLAFTHSITKQATPTITASGTPNAVTTDYGSPSVSTNFSLSGAGMSEGILVTAPSGFEVSINNITFTPTVSIGGAGNIPATTIYIRLTALTNAGNHSGNIVASSAGASALTITMPASTVNKVDLTVTANDALKRYGETLISGPGSTAFTAAGLKNGETIGTVTTGYGPGAAATDGVGDYSGCVTAAEATGGTFNPNNYDIYYVGATILVSPALLKITANDEIKTYGDILTGGAGSTAFTAEGLQNGEQVGLVRIDYGSGAAATDGVGFYLGCVTVANATGGTFSPSNYTIDYVAGAIDVRPATVTITAEDVTKVYGQTLADYAGSTAFTATGLKNGETVSSVSINYGTGGQADYPAQACSLCVNAANPVGTFGPNNYAFEFNAGNINVTPAPVIVTADNQSRLYGEPNPQFTVTYSGLLNGDTPAQFDAQPVVTTTATITSPVGQYPITASGALSLNYEFQYVPGLLTVSDSFPVPNAFTPNGDGINDTWRIQFLESSPNCFVTIFNRSGQRIYQSRGYGIPWDGTYNGSAMPVGVYYYTIQLNNLSRALSGHITLIR